MKKILFIDDDSSITEAYKGKFAKEYNVLLAGTGKEGITKAIKDYPDLIVLDIMLTGGMNGFDVLGNLKHNSATSKIPVVVLTNLEAQEDSAKAAGAVECLVKANTPIEKVGEVVKKYL